MATTAERLQLYYASEARTLAYVEASEGDAKRRHLDNLAEIRKGIAELESKQSRETAAANTGRVGPAVMFGDVSGRYG